MNGWKITWFDGMALRVTHIPQCDFYHLASAATSAGVFTGSVISIEKVPV